MKPYPHKATRAGAGRIVWGIVLLAAVVLTYVSVRAFKVRTEAIDPPPSPGTTPLPGLVGRSIHDFLPGTKVQSATGNIANPFPAGKVYLLEFYFHRCPPCRLKHPALQRVDAMIEESELEIIYVDNGESDDVEDFRKRLSVAEKQYYDSAALLIQNLQINSFPFELIIDKEGVIRYISKGFDKTKAQEYINKTVDKIKSLQ